MLVLGARQTGAGRQTEAAGAQTAVDWAEPGGGAEGGRTSGAEAGAGGVAVQIAAVVVPLAMHGGQYREYWRMVPAGSRHQSTSG